MAGDKITYMPPSVEASYYATHSAEEVLALALEVHEYAVEIGDQDAIVAAERIFAIGEAKIDSG